MKRKLETHSEAHEKYLRRLRLKKVSILGMQIGLLVLLLVLWEALTRVGAIDVFYFSSPSRIWQTFVRLAATGELWKHVGTTLGECLLGFAVASVLGLAIAIALWWNDTARKVVDPYIVVLNSLPKIALGPIIIVWAGIGVKAIVIMSVLISFVATMLSVLGGFLNCDSEKILLMHSMGANKWQILTKLALPNAVPEIIAALKLNIGLSWVGTIMGEYLASKAGLGYLIVYGGQVFQLDLVMCATVILCVLATGMYLIISVIEKHIKRKRQLV